MYILYIQLSIDWESKHYNNVIINIINIIIITRRNSDGSLSPYLSSGQRMKISFGDKSDNNMKYAYTIEWGRNLIETTVCANTCFSFDYHRDHHHQHREVCLLYIFRKKNREREIVKWARQTIKVMIMIRHDEQA